MMRTGKSAIIIVFTFLIFIVLSSNSLASAGSFVIKLVEEHEKFVDPDLLEHYKAFENMVKKAMANGTPIEDLKMVEQHGDFTYELCIGTIKEYGNQTIVDLDFSVYWRGSLLPFALVIRPPFIIVDRTHIPISFYDDMFRYHYNITYPKEIVTKREAWNILVNYLESINYNGSLEDIRDYTMPWKRFVMLERNKVHRSPNFADIMSHNIKFNVSAGVWIPAYIYYWVNWTHRKEYHLYISAVDGKILEYGYYEIRTYCDNYSCVSNTRGIKLNFWNYGPIVGLILMTSIILLASIASIISIMKH